MSGRVGVYNDGCGLRTLWFKSSLRYGPDPILDVFEGEKTKSFRNHEPLYITVSWRREQLFAVSDIM